MKTILNGIIAICLIFALAAGCGVAYLIYKGLDYAGDGVTLIQKEGLKGFATRLWCGEKGC